MNLAWLNTSYGSTKPKKWLEAPHLFQMLIETTYALAASELEEDVA
jgi:hypothetical protein